MTGMLKDSDPVFVFVGVFTGYPGAAVGRPVINKQKLPFLVRLREHRLYRLS
jgi:hypothetical protein